MSITTVKFKDWVFQVDKEATLQAYTNVKHGGTNDCTCGDCLNYATHREKIFPAEVLNLFEDLGVDFRKEVEIMAYEELPDNVHHIGGWFHFKGEMLQGEDCMVASPYGGHTYNLFAINKSFSIGFTKGNALTFFEDRTGLIQIEFNTYYSTDA